MRIGTRFMTKDIGRVEMILVEKRYSQNIVEGEASRLLDQR